MSDKPEKKITSPVVAADAAANGPTTLTEAELDAVSGVASKPPASGWGGAGGNGGSFSFNLT